MLRRAFKGFTLVEIMIVVAIIGILIAIAVPGFIKARNTSRTNACQENMTKVDGAVQQYVLDENFPTVEDAGCDDTGWQTLVVGPDNYLRSTPECPAGPVGVDYLVAESAEVTGGLDPVGCPNGPLIGNTLPDHLFPQ